MHGGKLSSLCVYVWALPSTLLRALVTWSSLIIHNQVRKGPIVIWYSNSSRTDQENHISHRSKSVGHVGHSWEGLSWRLQSWYMYASSAYHWGSFGFMCENDSLRNVCLSRFSRTNNNVLYHVGRMSRRIPNRAQQHWAVRDMPSDPHLENQTHILASQPAFSW